MSDYHKQFRKPLTDPGDTRIVCVHPFLGTEEFWLTAKDFQAEILNLVRVYWASGYSILMMPV